MVSHASVNNINNDEFLPFLSFIKDILNLQKSMCTKMVQQCKIAPIRLFSRLFEELSFIV